MEVQFGEYVISDNKARIQIDTVKGFLARSYWANRRTGERIERSVENSLCYGVYHGSRQVAFARVVTDYATMYWLCDVFVDEEHRGQGIGKKLVECITASEELRNLVGILGTKDAHGLYRSYHFESDPERFMRRAPDYLRT